MSAPKQVFVVGDSGVDHIAISHKNNFSSDNLFLKEPQSGYVKHDILPAGATLLKDLIENIIGKQRVTPFGTVKSWETYSEWEMKEADKKEELKDEIESEFDVATASSNFEYHFASLKNYLGKDTSKFNKDN